MPNIRIHRPPHTPVHSFKLLIYAGVNLLSQIIMPIRFRAKSKTVTISSNITNNIIGKNINV